MDLVSGLQSKMPSMLLFLANSVLAVESLKHSKYYFPKLRRPSVRSLLKVWRGCTLRVFAIGDSDTTKNEDIRKGLQKYIYMLRIDAKIFMVNLLDLEVSDEVLEKTAELEKRQQAIKNDIRKSRSRESTDSFNNDDTLSSRKYKLEDSVRSFTPIVININENAETSFIDNPADGLYRTSLTPSEEETEDVRLNVHKMNTAVRLNHVIRENSPSSQLVLLNLPRPPKFKSTFQHSYMIYLDVLTENLQRVLFIGGSGKEVISIHS
ncbi:hypothetical protein KIN20_017240 [Parelaphostrongylus tenuis]|uniref:SLC12A transporter C-terminal domain-containing protein n=1 Tax=Parelaphostrongylus tenuis TaxID=148309 RepID=A0AAD5QNI4_PARTN|nr:hypothetical protein KIN20_017240 [Parelaphostrongylus tenuis]